MEQKIFDYQNLYYINDLEIQDLIIKDNKLFYKQPCWKCGGKGRISYYSWNYDGVCFLCGGTGYHWSSLKTYKLKRNAEKALQKQIQLEKEHLDQLEMKRQQCIEKFKTIYIVSPLQNTIQIKDYLKEIGCVWSGKVWYKNNKEGFKQIKTITINIQKELTDNVSTNTNLKNIAHIINTKIQPILMEIDDIKYNKDFSSYKEGNQYIFDITETLSKQQYQSYWGICYYYILLDKQGYKLKYTTNRNLNINGKYKATVKNIEKDLLVVTRLIKNKQ